jgi:hypothetical protein
VFIVSLNLEDVPHHKEDSIVKTITFLRQFVFDLESKEQYAVSSSSSRTGNISASNACPFSFHVLVILFGSESRLSDIETVIGMDSFVSVLFKPERQTLYQALNQFQVYYKLPHESESCRLESLCFLHHQLHEQQEGHIVGCAFDNLMTTKSITTTTTTMTTAATMKKNKKLRDCSVLIGYRSAQTIDKFVDIICSHSTTTASSSSSSSSSSKGTAAEQSIPISFIKGSFRSASLLNNHRFLDLERSILSHIVGSPDYNQMMIIGENNKATKRAIKQEQQLNHTNHEEWILFDQENSPILLNEAAVEKEDQIRIRKLKKTLPKKGVVLALFAQNSAKRTQLALASVLMGALGFGLRWRDNIETQTDFFKNELVMNELEKHDKEIISILSSAGDDDVGGGSSSSDVSSSVRSNKSVPLPDHMIGFTSKSKKEVKHAPWIMMSENLVSTFDSWRVHLESYVCIVAPNETGDNEKSSVERADDFLNRVRTACGGGGGGGGGGLDTFSPLNHLIVVDSMDAWGMYVMYQKLRAIVGNVRALSPEEALFITKFSEFNSVRYAVD